MKYIDADRLNADLDKWVEAMADAEGDYSDGVRFAIQHFIFLIASLQQVQPEVDLDAIVNEVFDKYSFVDGYGRLAVAFNRAELYSFIKKITRKV